MVKVDQLLAELRCEQPVVSALFVVWDDLALHRAGKVLSVLGVVCIAHQHSRSQLIVRFLSIINDPGSLHLLLKVFTLLVHLDKFVCQIVYNCVDGIDWGLLWLDFAVCNISSDA